MRSWSKLAIGGLAVALAVAGCAGSGGDTGGDDAAQSGPRELTVWLMNGSAPETLTNELHKEFEAANPGVTIKYQTQPWNGIQDKLTTALASNNPPDVIELGNTQSPKFASEGVLMDLSADAGTFNKDQWLGGLAASATWDGKQYAVPFYAASRVVLYRKDMFEKAGITEEPATSAEWLTAIEKLKAEYGSDKDFQPLYLPGQNWYALLSFIWDAGGEVATQDGTTFTAALDSPQAKAGIDFYKKLVEVSGTTAPKDSDEQNPPQAGIYGGGKVGMFIGVPWEVATAAESDPKLTELTGAFPIPGQNGPAPVFQGGSNLAIPANSQDQDLAKAYISMMSSAKYQAHFAEAGMIPGTSTDVSAMASAGPAAEAMAKSSANGKGVPATPGWATIEAGQNPLKDMMTAYLTGAKTLDEATADANAALNEAFSGS